MDISHVTWRKATYSGANGGGCVEVGVWHKASHSGGNGGDCVEVASIAEALVAVRDSKNLMAPTWRSRRRGGSRLSGQCGYRYRASAVPC